LQVVNYSHQDSRETLTSGTWITRVLDYYAGIITGGLFNRCFCGNCKTITTGP